MQTVFGYCTNMSKPKTCRESHPVPKHFYLARNTPSERWIESLSFEKQLRVNLRQFYVNCVVIFYTSVRSSPKLTGKLLHPKKVLDGINEVGYVPDNEKRAVVNRAWYVHHPYWCSELFLFNTMITPYVGMCPDRE